MSLKVIFAGTPDFATFHLQALINSHHELVAVYTQPDRPAGRGKKLSPSSVKQLALAHDLIVEQPPSLKDEAAQETLAAYGADVMVVVAYGLLLPQVVLDTPAHGCLNVHGSLLPRWRGAAPIQRAVEAGDIESGVTIMQMDKGLDTGDMLLKSTCVLSDNETSASLHDKLMKLGAPALLEVLSQIEKAQLQPEKQDDSQACYAEKIDKAEANIEWQNSASNIERKIRAFNPFPISYTFINDQRIKVYQAQVLDQDASEHPGTILNLTEAGLDISCGEQTLRVLRLQVPGKKPMTVADLINGYSQQFQPGLSFSRG